MDLTHYNPTELEKWIVDRYRSIGINYASDMDIEAICDLLGIELRFDSNTPSYADWGPRHCYIFIDAKLSIQERRSDFFHELCHPLRHVGVQDNMSRAFIELQEIQAAHFQYYAAMPYYMISEFQYVSSSLLVKTMAEEFMLPEKFVERRLEQVKRRIQVGVQDHEINTRWNTPVKVTKEDICQVLEEFTRRKKERERAY